jgi:hypothetical protein
MLEFIAAVLIILWVLGLATSTTMGRTHSRIAGDRHRGRPAEGYWRTKSRVTMPVRLYIRVPGCSTE